MALAHEASLARHTDTGRPAYHKGNAVFVLSERLQKVLESAARLQQLVPEAVLVGGTASALHAGHRLSLDHDHVVADLADRYAEVLAAVEASEGWVTSVRASSPPLTLLGSLDGIEAGLRQLRRTRPLEVEDYLGYQQPSGVAPLLRRAIAAAREAAEAAERAEVATLVDRLIAESGLSMAEFASRVGTSRSRMSTYRSGRVVPAATMVVRMRRVSSAR
jgi:transcriptional regulator with XRE-family HTH domain